MDPALWEMLAEDARDEIEAIIRLHDQDNVPAGVRLITRFGHIATCRLPRQTILAVREDEAVASLKAPRLLTPDPAVEDAWPAAGSSWQDTRISLEQAATGQGVVVGVVDWGCDFAHPNFRHADGRTRLLALWDQQKAGPPHKYGYGIIYTQAEINKALAADDPYLVLGHHPAVADVGGSGAHGTHVLDIAAGNGRVGPAGIAPDADLIFVHLASRGTEGLATLGDSVTLLEAIDFIFDTAGERPCVINLSMGRHGGAHDGLTLVEQALDNAVSERPGRAIVQSCGNYYQQDTHGSGQVRPGRCFRLGFYVDAADVTPNELEIWYPGSDRFGLKLLSPDGQIELVVPLGKQSPLLVNGREVGTLYHRAKDPNNGDNHINLFLDPGAPPGEWMVELTGQDVVDGRFHAWLERDAGCANCQPRFHPDEADPFITTGTICNGWRTIAVGAYNVHSPRREIAPFSSCGPTRDGRQKPDLLAPGVQILAARSTPRPAGHASDRRAPYLTRKSGTSMAAPHVTGTVACMFSAAPRPLTIRETRNLLLGSTDPAQLPDESPARIGSGYLNIAAALAAAAAVSLTDHVDEDGLSAVYQLLSRHKNGEVIMNAESEPFVIEMEPVTAVSLAGEDIPVMVTGDEAIVETGSDWGETGNTVGQVRVAGQQFLVTTTTTTPSHTGPNLDAALRFALQQRGSTLILGRLSGGNCRVFHWQPPRGLATPPVIEFDTTDVIALVVNGGTAVYFPTSPTTRTLRWVNFPDARDFYRLPAAQQAAHKQAWARRLERARLANPATSRPFTRAELNALSMPALRLWLAANAAAVISVQTVRRGNPRQDRGGATHGVTLPILHQPLTEPVCYLPVISQVEGRLESVNAWDWGAGISIGPIQINVQRGALFRFLDRLWREDRALFDQVLGRPLGWAMQTDGGHFDLVIGSGGTAMTLHGREQGADVERNYRYFQSGQAGGRGYNPAFRRDLAGRFRDLLVWPHVQAIALEVTAWWLQDGLDTIHRAGIPRLDPVRPDRDTYILKAMLLSVYVRFSGCLQPMLDQLARYRTVAEKLQNWETAVNNMGAPCQQAERRAHLRRRLQSQRQHAQDVFTAVQQLTGAAASGDMMLMEDDDMNEWIDELPVLAAADGVAETAVIEQESALAELYPVWEDAEINEGDAYESFTTPALTLVDLADDLVEASEMVGAAALLNHLLPGPPAEPALAVLSNGHGLAPRLLFESLAHQQLPALARRLSEQVQVVARPGETLADLQPGDVLLRQGEGYMHVAVLADGLLYATQELMDAGLMPEGFGGGVHAQVVEAGPFPHSRADRFARRLGDDDGRLSYDSLILRLTPDALTEDEDVWFGESDGGVGESTKEPAPVPTTNPVPFAPAPPAGSYWPVVTSHRQGRAVNYLATDGTYVGGNASRRFLADRSSGARYHVGIDLYGNLGDPVVAIEDGRIVNFYPFCCGETKTTWALLVEHSQVVVNYGEVAPDSLRRVGLSRGDTVRAGQVIAYVGRNPGGSTMIHFETYVKGTRANKSWRKNQTRPSELLNPTKYLLYLQAHGRSGSTSGTSTGGGAPASPTTGGGTSSGGSFWTRLGALGQQVVDALRSGSWTVALRLAIAGGQRDENQLTNMLFFARHPERNGRALDRNDPNFQQLSQEWLQIRDQLVRPALTAPRESLPDETVTLAEPGTEVAPAVVAAGVAVAGLGYQIFKGILDNEGDIYWQLQQMDGAKHPFDRKTQYENIAAWQTKRLQVRQKVTNKLGDEISATFELGFKYNGYSVGYVSMENTGTNDAALWGLKVEAKIMADPQAYKINNKQPIAALDVTFNYRFTRTIGSDSIYVERLKLYGNGRVDRNGRWTQW